MALIAAYWAMARHLRAEEKDDPIMGERAEEQATGNGNGNGCSVCNRQQ
jgi:hypothetical protein